MHTSPFTVENQQITEDGLSMNITNIYNDDIHIKYGKYFAEKPFRHTVTPKKESVLTCHCLVGSSDTLSHQDLDIPQGSSLLFVEEATSYEHIMYTDQNKKGIFIETAVSQNFFNVLFEGENNYLDQLANPLNGRIHLPINCDLHQNLQLLTTHPYQGKLAEHFLQSKIIEIHLLQYQNWLVSQSKAKLILPPKDREAIIFIKQFIEQHYNLDFTIKELALKVGINQTKLKIGFKHLFDTTIFKYSHDIRMNKAMELVRENDLTIYEIAETIGYKHSHHFSSAFKKYFGILPSKLK